MIDKIPEADPAPRRLITLSQRPVEYPEVVEPYIYYLAPHISYSALEQLVNGVDIKTRTSLPTVDPATPPLRWGTRRTLVNGVHTLALTAHDELDVAVTFNGISYRSVDTDGLTPLKLTDKELAWRKRANRQEMIARSLRIRDGDLRALVVVKGPKTIEITPDIAEQQVVLVAKAIKRTIFPVVK